MLSLAYQPIAFFQSRLSRPPSWWPVLVGPLGCAVLAGAGHAVFSARLVRPVYEVLAAAGGATAFATSLEAMGVISMASVPVLFWLLSSAFMVAVDVLCRDGHDLQRIVEANGLAFYSQIPWLSVVLLVAWTYEPGAAWRPQGDVATPADIERLARLVRQDAVVITIRVLNECSTAWLYGLFGAGYHVATGVALWRALVLTFGMYGAFHLLRYAL